MGGRRDRSQQRRGSLQARTGLSKPKLRDALRDQIGVAPELYARIVRFRRTLAIVQADGERRLSEVAFDATTISRT